MRTRITKQEQLDRLKSFAKSKDGELLSTEFLTAKDKYKFRCKENHEFELTSDKVVSRGDWCPYCAGRYGDFNSKYKKLIESHNGKMLSKYVNAKTNIQCRCQCGNEFSILPSNLLAGKWCGMCNISHGESAIKKYLDEKNITYIQQYTFDDCKGKRNALPFDFGIIENNKLVCLIEYDGEQHFRPMRHSQNEKENMRKFKQVQLHDKIKNKYCHDNNIPLIRISFFDVDERRLHNLRRDVHKILDDQLLPMLISVPSLNEN